LPKRSSYRQETASLKNALGDGFLEVIFDLISTQPGTMKQRAANAFNAVNRQNHEHNRPHRPFFQKGRMAAQDFFCHLVQDKIVDDILFHLRGLH
jgi:hypothetical protein